MWLIELLNKVKNGETKSLNVNEVKYVILTLSKSFVTIVDPYGEEGNPCRIDTESFMTLVIDWLREKDLFYKNRSHNY